MNKKDINNLNSDAVVAKLPEFNDSNKLQQDTMDQIFKKGMEIFGPSSAKAASKNENFVKPEYKDLFNAPKQTRTQNIKSKRDSYNSKSLNYSDFAFTENDTSEEGPHLRDFPKTTVNNGWFCVKNNKLTIHNNDIPLGHCNYAQLDIGSLCIKGLKLKKCSFISNGSFEISISVKDSELFGDEVGLSYLRKYGDGNFFTKMSYNKSIQNTIIAFLEQISEDIGINIE